MRLRVRLKSLCVLAVLCVCVLVYTFFIVHADGTAGTHNNKVARITREDLISLGHYSEPMIPKDQDANFTPTQAYPNPAPPLSHNVFSTLVGGKEPCDTQCQLRHLNSQSEHARAPNSTKVHRPMCDRMCRKRKLIQQGLIKSKAYASRVQVENVTLPESWTVTQELEDRLSLRRDHVRKTCRKYGLDKPTSSYQPNAWEFLINERYGLVWCNVFKAASSTWIYNFNLLAGYSEKELLEAKEAPINLARKRYPRPTVQQLQTTLDNTNPPLAFMIARHPFKRLVSAYRDKILSGSRYYSKVTRIILKQYQNLGPGVRSGGGSTGMGEKQVFGRSRPQATVPSFAQFIQYLLDENNKGAKLDEHWTPINTFCTPCLVPFDVFAKVETLEEDGNYIIFSAGIADVIRPKRINRSRDKPTEEVADKFLCQLTKSQMEGLMEMYKYDIELFQYDVSKYKECTMNNT